MARWWPRPAYRFVPFARHCYNVFSFLSTLSVSGCIRIASIVNMQTSEIADLDR